MVLPSFNVCFDSIQTSFLLNWFGVARRGVILCSGEVTSTGWGSVRWGEGEGSKELSVWWLGV